MPGPAAAHCARSAARSCAACASDSQSACGRAGAAWGSACQGNAGPRILPSAARYAAHTHIHTVFFPCDC